MTTKQGEKITEYYAWIVTETDGTEGVPALFIDNTWYPAATVRLENMQLPRIKTQIKKLREMGFPVKLVKFHNMEVLEVLVPMTEDAANHE